MLKYYATAGDTRHMTNHDDCCPNSNYHYLTSERLESPVPARHTPRNTPTPKAGLEYPVPHLDPTMLWQVMPTSTP